MSGPVRPPLTVETVDGTTVGRPITKIKVTNGDLVVSGTTATIDTSGSGGSPGGSDTEIQYNDSGAFGGDAGFKITTKGGGATTTIRSGNMLLGGGKLATATANGFVSLISDGVGQIFLTSGADQGGTFTDTQVNIFANTNTDNAILNFRDSSNTENGRITLKDDGNLEIKNSVSGKNLFFQVTGSAGITIKQDATDTDSALTVEGNGTGLPKINLTNNTKSVTLLCDENQKLKVDGGVNTFVFDVSSASGGVTFPDGTTQTTAASGVSFPLTAPDGSKTAPSYSFSNDTDTGMFLVSAGILGIAVGGDREIRFKQDELQFDGGGGSQYKLTTDGGNTNILIQPNTGEASIEVEAGGGSQNVKISGANGGTVSFNGNYNFPVSDGSANQVLQTNGSGTLSFADSGGGGGIGGSIASSQIAFGSSTADEIEGESALTWNKSDNYLAINSILGGASGTGLSVQAVNNGTRAAQFQAKGSSTNASVSAIRVMTGLVSGSQAAGFGTGIEFMVGNAGFAGSVIGTIKTERLSSDSDHSINISPAGTGNVSLGNFTFDADQTVGASQDNFVLTYDNSAGLISLEAAGGGGGSGISNSAGNLKIQKTATGGNISQYPLFTQWGDGTTSSNAIASFNTTTATLYPFFGHKTGDIQSITYNITSAVDDDWLIRVYDVDSDNLPQNAVGSEVSGDNGSTGDNTLDVSGITDTWNITAGDMYYIAIMMKSADNNRPTVRAYQDSETGVQFNMPYCDVSTAQYNIFKSCFKLSGLSGSLPSSVTTSNLTSDGAPFTQIPIIGVAY